MVYFTKSIFTIPAGIEMIVRTIGSSLLTNTPTLPFSRSMSILLSTASFCFGNFLKYKPMIWLPVLLLCGLVTGLFTGLCAQLLLRRRLISDKGDTHDESQKK